MAPFKMLLLLSREKLHGNYKDLIGESTVHLKVLKRIDTFATSDRIVLISGKTGTGKELVAHALHAESSYAIHPMVIVNCAGIAEGLTESELFGHEKGAFTGADQQHIGRFCMFRGLLSSRLIQVGLVFFIVVVGGSLLYSWHTRRATVAEFTQTDMVPHETRSEKDTVDTSTVDFEQTETPFEVDDLQMSDDTDAPPIDETSEMLEMADAFLPDDLVSEEEAPAEDVPVSPHGFGPYPEVPEDFPLPVYWTDRTERQELLMRVMIKAWTEGERFISGNIVDGKVCLNFPNTVYVRYKEIPTADGSVISTRVIAGATDIEGPPPGEDFPPGVRVLDFDEAGIDPYEYLDLP